jgi:hypothetical protein
MVSSVNRYPLRKAPRLLSAYLMAMNGAHTRASRNRWGLIGLFGAGVVVVAVLLVPRESSISTAVWIHRHRIFLAGAGALLSAASVSRRRASKQAEAARSWLAAPPVRAVIARWEAVAIETAPALGAICIMAAAFGMAALTVWVGGSSTGLAGSWLAIAAGIVLGTLIGYVVPLPKPEELPPGSRYVPQRRVKEPAAPTPRLSALGRWPVREMFARARPKVVSRAILPILLAMPLGSTADVAMLVIGISAVVGAMILLLAASVSVSKASYRWLRPLPLSGVVLARHLLTRALTLISSGGLVTAWLLWVMGKTVGRSLKIGLLLAFLSCLIVVGGCLNGMYRAAMRGR